MGEQDGAFFSGRLVDMVEMQIKEIERFAGFLFDEPRPGADADADISPVTGAGYFRGIGKPECVRFVHVEQVAAVKDCRVFAIFVAVFAGDAYPAVFAECGAYFGYLKIEGLLETYDIGIMAAQDVENHLLSIFPVVLAVLGGAVSNIETHHPQLQAVFCPGGIGTGESLR
jgi:hypothetical protein